MQEQHKHAAAEGSHGRNLQRPSAHRFIASIIAKKLQEELKDTSLNPASAFQLLRNQKCKVFADTIIPQEAVKKVNDLYKKFGMKSPKTIARKPNPV
jgi:hypothetical protein